MTTSRSTVYNSVYCLLMLVTGGAIPFTSCACWMSVHTEQQNTLRQSLKPDPCIPFISRILLRCFTIKTMSRIGTITAKPATKIHVKVLNDQYYTIIDLYFT